MENSFFMRFLLVKSFYFVSYFIFFLFLVLREIFEVYVGSVYCFRKLL